MIRGAKGCPLVDASVHLIFIDALPKLSAAPAVSIFWRALAPSRATGDAELRRFPVDHRPAAACEESCARSLLPLLGTLRDRKFSEPPLIVAKSAAMHVLASVLEVRISFLY